MLRIILLLFELNYAFTIGYVPLDDLQICIIQKNSNLFFTEFETEIKIKKVFFVYGRIKATMYERELFKAYDPYQMEFEIKLGLTIQFIEIGFSHYCVHPILSFQHYYETLPEIFYEGAREELYIKFSNKED